MSLVFIKKAKTLLTQFLAIIHITSEFNFYEKANTLLAQCWEMIYLTSDFNFFEENRNFIGSVLGNNLHN